ncbi:lysozyme [Aquilutibacter rugosus]|uniref:lysozyme n=1 Tax=Aquilutibacter rugosus TaxID=3115820 RepID=UPI002F410B8B
MTSQDWLPLALASIKRWEGCRLKAYRDPATSDGLPITIGWGSTRDQNDKPIAIGAVWTQAMADDMLERDVLRRAEAIDLGIKTRLNACQFAACVSLSYNIGVTAFLQSTLLRKINARDFDAAEREFARWTRAGGKVVQGLVNRRKSEAALFATPVDGDRCYGVTM